MSKQDVVSEQDVLVGVAASRPRSSDVGDPLSQQRTDLAVRRTRLAEERTFAAWVRTGLAALAAGLAVAKLLYENQMEPLARVMAMGLVVAAGGSFLLGWWGYTRGVRELMTNGEPMAPRWVIGGLSFLFLGGVLISVVLIVS